MSEPVNPALCTCGHLHGASRLPGTESWSVLVRCSVPFCACKAFDPVAVPEQPEDDTPPECTDSECDEPATVEAFGPHGSVPYCARHADAYRAVMGALGAPVRITRLARA